MRLIIIGAGGYGRTVADLAQQSGRYEQIAFLDDQSQEPDVLGICGAFAEFEDGNTEMYPAFGNNELRLAWLDRLEQAHVPVMTLVHPTAYVSPTGKVGAGTVVLPHAVVNTACAVNRGCIINCGAIVDHGCLLEEGVHVCLGAVVKAENRIPKCMKIEAGTVVENRTYPL